MEAGGGGEDTGLEESGSGGTEEPRSAQRTRRFSGNGSKNIGTVKVTDDAVMEWTHRTDGEAILGFTAYDADFNLSVDSKARRGTTALEPGTYRSIDVAADGDWTITIRGR